jgi:hypothetical protein
MSVIPHTAITIEGDTALHVCSLFPADVYRQFNHLCDTCQGEKEAWYDGWHDIDCPDCYNTGRHTFEILISEVFVAGDGDNAIRITELTVHVLEVIPIYGVVQQPKGYPFIMMHDEKATLHHIPKAQAVRTMINLPDDADSDMYGVRLAVHT